MKTPVRGAGGGGKGGGGGGARAPVEASDSLRSKQYARVLDLVSEGEIGGLVAGAQSIFLDGVPLANPDGSYNFQGVYVDWRVGTQAQTYLPGFPAAEAEFAVGTEVTASGTVTRTITNSNVSRARVTLGVPQLTQQDSTTGDLFGAGVDIVIQLQSNGGGYSAVVADTITGKTTTRYQRSYEIALTGSAPWDIRVLRVTADSTSVLLQNRSFFDSYTEIIDAKLANPNSAVVGIEIDSAQFNQVPTRGYEIYGVLVQIPSNYDPATRAYTGSWDGTFATAWTDNPAWVLYDLLTNTRYGLGAFVDADQVDKWSLYSIAQYCDELVDDGFGGEEPRFTCNLYLQTRAEAFRVIASVASIFRGMAYWGAGAVVAVADMPSDAVALFTKANVIDGKFVYAGSARNTRHTVALVTWNDPADGYRQKVEYVEDRTGIARYGVVETEVLAFGCASRGQAHRLGKWILYSERLETETVTFRAGLDGVLAAPGEVIQTQDPARAGKRFGGRVVSATTSAVTIDNAVTIESGKTYTLSIITSAAAIASAPVTNSPGSTSTLNLSPALSAAPQVNAIWVLAASDLEPQTWRVVSAAEADKAQLEIVALAHNPDKYDAVEQDLILEPAQTSLLTARPAGVTNLAASETLFEAGPGIVSNRVTLSWSGTTSRYLVSYRSTFTNWVVLPETPSQTIDIDGLAADHYTFNVVQLSGLGIASPVNTLMQDVYGKTAPPADISGFAVQSYSGQAKFTWDLADDLDVRVGGRVIVRWTPLTSSATWEEGSLVADDGYPGSTTIGFGPLMTGTYLAKARDSSGNFSETAASFVVTEALITGLSTIATVTESPTFAGTKVNTFVDSAALQLAGATLWDDMPGNIDDWNLLDYAGGVSPTGSYTFASKLDLGSVTPARLFANIDSLAFDTGDLWDSRTDDIDDWGLVDGAVIEDAEATLMVRATDDDPNGSPTWGPWHALGLVGDYDHRGFDFRLDFTSEQVTHNRRVTTLSVTAKH